MQPSLGSKQITCMGMEYIPVMYGGPGTSYSCACSAMDGPGTNNYSAVDGHGPGLGTGFGGDHLYACIQMQLQNLCYRIFVLVHVRCRD